LRWFISNRESKSRVRWVDRLPAPSLALRPGPPGPHLPIAFLKSATSAFISLCLISCATVSDVADEYREAIAPTSSDPSGKQLPDKIAAQTSILILVDGLSIPQLNRSLSANEAPALTAFFSNPAGNLKKQSAPWYRFGAFRKGGLQYRFDYGRASFPSLTYPNLVSILTGSPVSRHRIIGNKIFANEEFESLNFENFLSWRKLDEKTQEKTIFSVLNQNGQTSVSFSYPFQRSATADQKSNIDAAFNYATADYLAVDDNTLSSLAILLKTTPPDSWPRFIFVHLISVDSTAHRFGPQAPEVNQAVRDLDTRLSTIFLSVLDAEASHHRTEVVLTADHGFTEIKRSVPIEEIVKKTSLNLHILADNRTAGLYLPKESNAEFRNETAESFLQIPEMELTASHNGSVINLYSRDGGRVVIDMADRSCKVSIRGKHFVECPEEKSHKKLASEFSSETAESKEINFNVSALVDYFSAPNSPDIILIPNRETDFSGEYKGNHGGMTSNELYVPILTRNIHFAHDLFPTYKILPHLGLLPQPKINP
jgi:Type I phosphodiesterase / nucleotide pyrophosphatase